MMSQCGCQCVCHSSEGDESWPGPCAACCEPGDDCACGRALRVNVATKDCPRCGVPIHAPDAPHLCADKVARMRTQEKWVQAVIDILVTDDNQPDHLRLTERELAEAIVKRLRNMGVEHD